ncbi:hypothetical protein FCULG_00008058 [Fusarium culmorum]|uniref:Ras modification protein ERF4 n=1 Tax=Fusarium culmorum TaxID=5516 RepID=A0A2T4GZZ7_FUSCU|nr:hypothetical protein FCULG_00008058 [Fusarium culmorum]
MLVFRASSSPSSTKTPVALSPASLCRFHWPTVSEFPLDVWSLRRFFSFFSPLTINDSSNSFARCRSITRYDESETDDDFTDITFFDPSHSLSIAEKSLATSRNRRIPSFSVSGSVFHHHPLRALPVSAQPQPELQRQKHIQRVGRGLSLADHTSTHVFPGRTADGRQPSAFHPSPFRPQKATGTAHRARRLSAARLWNPTNSTPRPHTKPESSRKRRPSTPPPPSIPLLHPTFDHRAPPDSLGAGPSDYPLLTLSEQHQIKHSLSPRASLQVDRAGSSDRRISLPNSVRASYDEKGSRRGAVSAEEYRLNRELLAQGSVVEDPVVKIDKGKGKAVMMPENTDPMPSYGTDLERGPDIMDPRMSNVSAGDGIGSALSTTNSSIMGEEVEPDAAGEWGPQHPCYPHRNPHVPVDSPEYTSTRIIRIRRDWLIKGDLAPTFSNLYPEILDPAGLSEQEFRRIIEKLNGELVPAFDPYSARNIIDSLLGLVTGWVWDDMGLTGAKSRLNNLEKWIEQWNCEMEKTMGAEDGVMPPKIMPLRQTGYMTLDIQIPDPEIMPAPSTANPNESRTALPMTPSSAIVA